MAAIVRGTDDAAARARLHKSLDTGDADLLATFDRLAEGRLQVYAGTHLYTVGQWAACRSQAVKCA